MEIIKLYSLNPLDELIMTDGSSGLPGMNVNLGNNIWCAMNTGSTDGTSSSASDAAGSGTGNTDLSATGSTGQPTTGSTGQSTTGGEPRSLDVLISGINDGSITNTTEAEKDLIREHHEVGWAIFENELDYVRNDTYATEKSKRRVSANIDEALDNLDTLLYKAENNGQSPPAGSRDYINPDSESE